MEIQILDVDYVQVDEKPIVRIFGKTEKGEVVCGFYEGYMPYFYVEKTDAVKELLSKEPQVIKIETVKRTPVGGYQKPKEFLKVTITNPSKTPEIREKLKGAGVKVYEADILFKYRFMSDFGLSGMQWIKLEHNGVQTHTVRADKCVQIKKIKPGDNSGNAPLRLLALDIECVSVQKGAVPDAKRDPIILISLVFSERYEGRDSLVLSTRPDGDVLSFASEKEMLEEFARIIEKYDPDIITGYNINNFDFPYILERMRQNKIKPLLGRCKQKSVMARKVMARYKISITGRVVVDSFEIIKKDFSLTRYGLDFVAEALLGEKKVDVKHSEIEKFWKGTNKDFKKLVEYSRIDSVLAMNLLVKLHLIDKYIALSRISGTLLQDTLDSGETTRIENFTLREFNKKGFIVPCKPDAKEVAEREKARKKHLKGGFVLEPEKGLHSNVIVLDFLSMYPSIIRTFNICPTTLVRNQRPEKVIKTPLGTEFASKEIAEGIIPKILEKLMKNRGKIKKKLKTTEDPEKKRLLNAEQWALKIMANAFYGHMGYPRAKIYDLDIANTVTYCGRYFIHETKKIIEEEIGYKVVYGDTDSVFVETGEDDLEKLREIGEQISKTVSDRLPGIMTLEFEKIFKRFLPLTKKRYMAWSFSSGMNGWEENIEMKGIETVRRDWCELVSDTTKKIIEIVLKENNVKDAVDYFRGVVKSLVKSEVPVKKLVITKNMTKQPKSYAGIQPHIELVKKMQTRNPAEAPGIGDRVSYVIIKGTGLLSKRAEDPVYVMEKGLEIDSNYYIENQILPPLERIFNALGISKSELLGNGKQTLLSDIINNNNNHKETKEIPITDLKGFICKNCQKTYSHVPLTGFCECGGEIVFSSSKGMAASVVCK
ncbi:MAG: DNA polymerase elongation subunit [Candidatus Aenigmatarchaeota archaeon]|nr:MAG: DNA polymerase elongation subunit [Candidatus Aenigmarchaeota archaeon]